MNELPPMGSKPPGYCTKCEATVEALDAWSFHPEMGITGTCRKHSYRHTSSGKANVKYATSKLAMRRGAVRKGRGNRRKGA